MSKTTIIKCQNQAQTEELAQNLAEQCKAPCLICLRGTLGMGKSTFARAFIRFLAQDSGLEVPSPTFTLVQTYETDKAALYHFDLYRLGTPEDIYELGWEDALYDSISLVEWPERAESLLPEERTDIIFEPVTSDQAANADETNNKRRITIKNFDDAITLKNI